MDRSEVEVLVNMPELFYGFQSVRFSRKMKMNIITNTHTKLANHNSNKLVMIPKEKMVSFKHDEFTKLVMMLQ